MGYSEDDFDSGNYDSCEICQTVGGVHCDDCSEVADGEARFDPYDGRRGFDSDDLPGGYEMEADHPSLNGDYSGFVVGPDRFEANGEGDAFGSGVCGW